MSVAAPCLARLDGFAPHMSMSCDKVDCPYDAEPDAAIAAIRAHDGPVLVDLDETLYLRNSTEDFIDCARPRLVALLLLRSLDFLRPWKFTGGFDTRDTWRTGTISLLFPWTYWRWKRNVRNLASEHLNQDLGTALTALAQPPVIVTAGFRPIVEPLVAALGFQGSVLVAARMGSFADRRNGKLCMAVRALGEQTVTAGLVVTDSVGDLDILRQCARPLRTVWPRARYEFALRGTYIPGEYLTRIKRPGERYILRGVLQEDFTFWWLSSIGLAASPLHHTFGLSLLLLSFWAIYERGYVDNDSVAARLETDPKLSEHFGDTSVATPIAQPWIWALSSGALGIAALRPDGASFVRGMAIWSVTLIGVHLCFKTYNRLDKATRVWLYPALQLARSAAFTVVVPISPVGAAALGAHAVSRWIPYQIYRLTKATWPETRPELVRAVIFVLLAILLVRVLGLSVLWTWTAPAILLWSLFRARRDIGDVIGRARRLR